MSCRSASFSCSARMCRFKSRDCSAWTRATSILRAGRAAADADRNSPFEHLHRRRLIRHQPEHPDLMYDLAELVEVDRLLDVGICTEAIAFDQIALLG